MRKGEKREYADYVCIGRQQHGRSVCSARTIRQDWIDGVVVDLIRSRLGTPEALAELERRVRQKVEARRRTYGESTEAVERKIAEVDRQIANYYRAIGEGLDPQVCREHIDELTEKKAELEGEAEVVRGEDYYQRALDRNLHSLRQFAEVYLQEFDQLPFGVRRKVVLHFIESIEVVEHRMVRITMRVPFDDAGLKHLTDEAAQGENGEPRPGAESLASTGASGMSVEKGNFFQLGTNWLPSVDHR